MRKIELGIGMLIVLLTGCGGPPKCNDSDVKKLLSYAVSNNIAKNMVSSVGKDKDVILRVLLDKYPVKVSNVIQLASPDKVAGSQCQASVSIQFKDHPFPNWKYGDGCENNGEVLTCNVPYDVKKTEDTKDLLISWEQPKPFITAFQIQEARGKHVFRD